MGTDGPWPPSWGSAVPHFGAMDPQILFLNRIFRHFDSNYGNGWAVAPLVGVRGPPRGCYGPPNLVPLSNNSTFRFQLWERMDRGPRGGPRPPPQGVHGPPWESLVPTEVQSNPLDYLPVQFFLLHHRWKKYSFFLFLFQVCGTESAAVDGPTNCGKTVSSSSSSFFIFNCK